MRERKSEYVSLHNLPEEYRRAGDEVAIAQRAAVQRMINEEQIMCRSCGNSFRSGRPRCPACGTVPKLKKEPRFRNAPRIREVAPTACCECKQRGAKIECEHCEKLLHPGCFTLHQCDAERKDIEDEIVDRREGELAGTNDAERPSFASASDEADRRRAS